MNAAVVQTISDSQADLGAHSGFAQQISLDELQSGTRIRVRGFSKPVIFRRLDGSSAEVEAGPLRMKVAPDEITGVETSGAASKPGTASFVRPSVTVSAQGSTSGSSGEINVIGMTVEQANERVDKFLDEAALAQLPRVRIIHGHGTGALRKGIGEFLASHPLVAKRSFEAEEHGGKAITVVELRS
jgi:DNA mismatch repair protein MutS2